MTGDAENGSAAARAIGLLRSLAGREWIDEDGERRVLELLPGLSDPEIDALIPRWQAPVPGDARALLRVSRGFADSPLESVDFGGLPGGAAPQDLFPFAVPIAHDGFGNYWLVDVTPGTDALGAVFFLCHDPPVVAYQCGDVAAFLEALAEMTHPPYAGPLDAVHEEESAAIWRGREAGVPRDAALGSGDEVLSDFAALLPAGSVVADLRRPRTGEGFRVLDARTYVRHSTEAVFAWYPAPSVPAPWAEPSAPTGLLARWMGRLFGH